MEEDTIYEDFVKYNKWLESLGCENMDEAMSVLPFYDNQSFNYEKALVVAADDDACGIVCPQTVVDAISKYAGKIFNPEKEQLRYAICDFHIPHLEFGIKRLDVVDSEDDDDDNAIPSFETVDSPNLLFALDELPNNENRAWDNGLFPDKIMETCCCKGFTAALVNLARNYGIDRYFEYGCNFEFPMKLTDLDFKFHHPARKLYQRYYDSVKLAYLFDYRDLPSTITDDDIDSYIFEQENSYYEKFTKSLMYKEFDEEQRKRIQAYHEGFMAFLKNRIGYDPEEKMKEEQTKQLQKKHKNIEPFKFVDDSVVDIEEKRNITERIINLVTHFPVQMICERLRELHKDNKLFIPGAPNDSIYNELIRLGMPGEDVEGFSRKNFNSWYYKAKQDNKDN